jgi:hypothetical protein
MVSSISGEEFEIMKLNAAQVFTVTLSALLIGAVTPSTARNIYRLHAIEQYKLGVETGMTCQYCHTQVAGGSNWNGFGQGMREVFLKHPKDDPQKILYLTLKAKHDSDQDGFIDVLEIIAKTLPGNPNSKPQKTVLQLETALRKMGGLDAFKPKN